MTISGHDIKKCKRFFFFKILKQKRHPVMTSMQPQIAMSANLQVSIWPCQRNIRNFFQGYLTSRILFCFGDEIINVI